MGRTVVGVADDFQRSLQVVEMMIRKKGEGATEHDEVERSAKISSEQEGQATCAAGGAGNGDFIGQGWSRSGQGEGAGGVRSEKQ